MRVGEAVAVAEFVQDHREGEAAALQAGLIARNVLGSSSGLSQPPLIDVEDADALLRAEGRILRIEIGAEIGARVRDRIQPELGLGLTSGSPHIGCR